MVVKISIKDTELHFLVVHKHFSELPYNQPTKRIIKVEINFNIV